MPAPEILPDTRDGHARAAALLRGGALVALPTETVYGLAADARSDTAVAAIYAAKGRPSFNPLIVHLPDLAAAEALASFPGPALALARAFWPGPLTLVLPLKPGHGLPPRVTAGLPTVAIRVPAHPAMQAVLRAFGGPVAAPSANPSGRISATTAAHVTAGLGDRIAAVLDAGPTSVGVESTILAPAEGGTRLLREGGLPREAIEPLTGPLLLDTTPGAAVEAPGQLSSHYAPRAPLHLGGQPQPGEITIGFGPTGGELTLSATGDLAEAAARLFATLHTADALAEARHAPAIRVAEIPETGLGRAINDRLRRAAAPRG
ncbi:L-threonylcarbamoyladenylate synthase [Roseicyclus persicicus]|uniref:Threonylcarbamoyl-AMP synthase n=1 Tax=Roseicyclus persicicus TaxID=2650661 RepID=A0A7X6JXY7_9RHOB|nr:L-threonylcarbamoyladenylate synthase [Roseibacterium persicicum]NKX43258.1 threonylcarbamoyl-AMP synthase [Roseibacterium persicicum]